jgi:hypothetical protein
MTLARAGLFPGVAVMIGVAPAWADAIDGQRCYSNGRRFAIAGSPIVTPAKTRTAGQSDRHGFNYVAPPSDSGAGSTVAMALLSETTVGLKPRAAPEAIWNRRGPPISLRAPRAIG